MRVRDNQLPGCGTTLKASKDYEIVATPERLVVCGYDERGAMYGLYNHDLTPRAHAVSVFRRALRGSGMKLRSLMRVGWHAVRGV